MQLQQLGCFPVVRKLTVLGCSDQIECCGGNVMFVILCQWDPLCSRSQRQQSIQTSVATKVETSFTFMSLQSASSCILSPTNRTPVWTQRTTQLNSTHRDQTRTQTQGATQLQSKRLVGTNWCNSYQTLTVSFWTTQTHTVCDCGVAQNATSL